MTYNLLSDDGNIYGLKCISILGLVGYDARLTRERSRVQSSEDVFCIFRRLYAKSRYIHRLFFFTSRVDSTVVVYLPSKQVARVRFPDDAFFRLVH
jgi:hypothetical protein